MREDQKPIDMVLYCPNCGMQHVDAPERPSEARPVLYADAWTNPPHRSHLCHSCGCIWRPADVTTNGVAELKTEGKADTWPVHADEVRAHPALTPLDARRIVDLVATERASARALALEEAATAIAQHDRKGREWIPGSLWDTLSNEAAARVRALANPSPTDSGGGNA